jgi:hypothetical protein
MSPIAKSNFTPGYANSRISKDSIEFRRFIKILLASASGIAHSRIIVSVQQQHLLSFLYM